MALVAAVVPAMLVLALCPWLLACFVLPAGAARLIVKKGGNNTMGREPQQQQLRLPEGCPYQIERRRTVKLSWMGAHVEFRGFDIVIVFIVIAIAAVAVFQYLAFITSTEAHASLLAKQLETTKAVDEMVYVISLPPEERARLKLDMPDSLRAKLGRRDDRR